MLTGSDTYKVDMIFEPQLERTFEYQFIGSGETQDYALSTRDAQGSLGEYITFEEETIQDVPADTATPFSFTLKLPENLEPGMHEAWINVAETKSPSGTLGATSSVAIRLFVRSLFEDPTTIWTTKTNFDSKEEQLSLIFEVENWWEKDMTNVKASVEAKRGTLIAGQASSDNIVIERGKK